MGDRAFVQHCCQCIAGQHARTSRQAEAGAATPGGEDFRYRSVEAQRGELQQSAARLDGERVDLRQCQLAQAVVFDQYAFGRAGGARGVDHVGEVIRSRMRSRMRIAQVVARLAVDLARAGVEGNALPGVVRQPAEGSDVRQHETWARIFELMAQPLRRRLDIDRRVRRTGLEYREQGHEGIDIVVTDHRDEIAPPDPAPTQGACHPVGIRIQFGIGQTRSRRLDGSRIRRTRGLGLEQIADRAAPGRSDLRRRRRSSGDQTQTRDR